MNVLFLCTGNSCRSLMGEALFNHLAPAGWHGLSAGSKPLGRLNNGAVELLIEKGISIEGYFSKSWNDLPLIPDIVISVCGNAANETCPVYLGSAIRSHWGVEDPAHFKGTEAEKRHAFTEVLYGLKKRIDLLAQMPLDKLDSMTLKDIHTQK